MDSPAISIIVPVYNTAAYLRQCVESVLAQSYTDWELILVDDGSTDESPALCDDLSRQDGRIRVLHQQNRGLPGARNAGLEEAAGRYVLFLDSDDFYRLNAGLESLVQIAESGSYDVVCFGYSRYYDDTNTFSKPLVTFEGLFGGPAPVLLPEMVKKNAWQSSACIKLIRHEALGDLRFPEGITGEDIEWSAALALRVHSIGFFDTSLYAYRAREGSISRAVGPHRLVDLVGTVERLAATQDVPEALRTAFFGYAAYQYCTLLINWQLSRPKPDRQLKQRAKQLSYLLKYDTNLVVKLTRITYGVLGFDLTGKLMLPFRS